MRIKQGFVLRSIAGNYMVVGEGLAQIDFNKIISLNETAAYLWKAVKDIEFSKEDLCRLLLDAYNVDEQTAAADASNLADKWIEAGLVEL